MSPPLPLGRIPYLHIVLVAVIASFISPLFNANPRSFSSKKLSTLMDNAPFLTSLDAYVRVVLRVMFVASFVLEVMTINLAVVVGLSATTSVIGGHLLRFYGEALEAVHLNNDIGLSIFAIISGVCFVCAVTQTFSGALLFQADRLTCLLSTVSSFFHFLLWPFRAVELASFRTHTQ